MTELNYDVYEGQSQEVPAEVLVAYAEQYFADYINTQVEVNGETYDFLPYLLSIINSESGSNLYTASNVDANNDGVYEASFGLFQVNWETENGTISHAANIVEKMIRDGVITRGEKESYLQNISNLDEEKVQKIVQYMSNIEIQFELASEIYKNRKRRTDGNNGDFEDWGARNAPTTAASYDNYKATVDNILAQPADVREQAKNNFAPKPIQFKSSQGKDVFDDPDAPQAPVAGTQGSDLDIKEQIEWIYNNTVKPLIDPTLGTNDFQITEFNNNFYGGALTDTQLQDLINNGVVPTQGLDANAVLGQFSRLAGSSSYRNPFLLSSQLSEPTLANAILAEVYNVYKKSANANGVLDADYLATAYLTPLIPNMLRAINAYMDSNGNLTGGYTIRDIVNDVSNLAGRDWQFGALPDYGNPDTMYDKNQLKNTATGLVSQLLLDDNEQFVNKVTADYIDYKIANPGKQIDFNSYVYTQIKNTGRYKMLYKNKPLGLTEQQFLSTYNSATEIAAPGDRSEIIASQATAGGTAETAAVAARFSESGARSNTFINSVEQSAETLAKLFGR